MDVWSAQQDLAEKPQRRLRTDFNLSSPMGTRLATVPTRAARLAVVYHNRAQRQGFAPPHECALASSARFLFANIATGGSSGNSCNTLPVSNDGELRLPLTWTYHGCPRSPEFLH